MEEGNSERHQKLNSNKNDQLFDCKFCGMPILVQNTSGRVFGAARVFCAVEIGFTYVEHKNTSIIRVVVWQQTEISKQIVILSHKHEFSCFGSE